ncbi:DNA-directed RNA polymerase subunit G [Ignicoccus hospitalis]|uniref:DNA-directed RNA polymerase subunit Rpo8 n=1 Tax=Ignicoccus hospitalis (strain KIN4/I / DSM 18386 / JCM 14125) TaxID=453591 RepID=A8ABP0_IGNH4|nr:DNA-directed RNA polymerase subunit G [Ignicoccus hospitalis]ABU82342.1 hypothetical protein Igni_1165 [Ignicoccus hospitalis KIN4/I]HIH89720.1 DNA-directed RNA polymerase subunit G [Desulfurococcaceae archaeon]
MECSGKVTDIQKGKIPYTNILVFECDDKKVEMLLHEDLITFVKGEAARFVVSEEVPQFKQGVDFCGRGVLVRDDGDKKLFSIGGFVVVLHNFQEKFKENVKYYICLMKEE